MNSLRTSLSYAVMFMLMIAGLSWIKISFICGTHTGLFSLSHCLSPLVGLFGGGIGAVILLTLRAIFKFSYATAASSVLLSCHIPSFCAALYLALTKHNNKVATILAAALPVACMALFCLHPVGAQAWTYSLFWIIPVAAATLSHHSFFVHALGSTFTAHAVGSILWLYLGLITAPAAWLALIPVVICERLLFAGGMVIARKALASSTRAFSHLLPNSKTKNAF
jgi:hypothetical protein